jgi:hypothetical protein
VLNTSVDQFKRREFITLVGGVAAAWPLAARAQQAAITVVGVLSSRPAIDSALQVAAFRAALGEAGYVERQNVAIDGAGLSAKLLSRRSFAGVRDDVQTGQPKTV